jgi:hypothetical protein
MSRRRLSIRGSLGATALFATVAVIPTLAHAQLGPREVKDYGGRYAIDCASAAAARVIVANDTMMIEQGAQRMTGHNLQSAVSYFGNASPPNFRVALLSNVRGNAQLIGLIYADRDGTYLQFDASDPKIRAAIGALATARFRDCDVVRSQRAAAQARADIAEERRDAADRSRNARSPFGQTYRRALGPLVRERWLTDIATVPLDRAVTIDGVAYRMGAGCKPHDCHDNNLVVLHSPTDGVVYGKVLVANRVSFIGNPSPTVQRELDRLWRAEWRQNG